MNTLSLALDLGMYCSAIAIAALLLHEMKII